MLHRESHAFYAAELKKLLRQRRQLRDRLAWAYTEQDEQQQFELTARITTLSRWLRQHKRRHWQQVQENRACAFEEARRNKDYHEAHRIARLL
eukprot:614436-Pyramimonas_sp.AAC.1